MPHSHHSHSGQFCKHASGLLEEVVQEAIRKRFQVYGLTEHVPRYREVDLYPEEGQFPIESLSSQFDSFVVEAHRLKSLYASQITLLVGLETEFITGLDLENLEKTLERFGDRVEYIVGSIHHVNGIPIDFDLPTYQQALASFADEKEEDRQEVFLSAYFDAQYELLRRFKPEVVGHFDLCRLYQPSLHFRDYPRVFSKIERNVRYAVQYGALFELNAAAFRKKWDTAYPAEDVVEVINSLGGRFALSDDSHGPNAVGLNYDRLPGYLQSVGVTQLWYLQQSTTPNAAGRRIQPVRLDGDWLDHGFWRQNTT
ncbi:Polymerase/histidinol phosphatase-like protein [Gymnopilus junonius]|uniref:Histidinol-phosphatase n=1 Tax=Gymnopilus junonius TaxID=109634 RepID=A0A9P5TGN4_GYMJU|nr:Polymerase/histidinol phosphatase-like protein [Gymnopilus junonius]